MSKNKYRAYDKENKIMVYSDRRNEDNYQIDYSFEFNPNGEVTCYSMKDYDDKYTIQDYDEYFQYPQFTYEPLDNIMQYIGMKDKNDKDMYEGDIVLIKGVIYIIEYNMFHTSFVAKFYDNDTGLKYEYYLTSMVKKEVIGNIHENTSLLERGSMIKKLWKFDWDFIGGLFLATDDEITNLIGKKIYLGEVASKHSDVSGVVEKDDITFITDNKEIIEVIGEFGFNPLNYLE